MIPIQFKIKTHFSGYEQTYRKNKCTCVVFAQLYLSIATYVEHIWNDSDIISELFRVISESQEGFRVISESDMDSDMFPGSRNVWLSYSLEIPKAKL